MSDEYEEAAAAVSCSAGILPAILSLIPQPQ
jgi:hypothetical protein